MYFHKGPSIHVADLSQRFKWLGHEAAHLPRDEGSIGSSKNVETADVLAESLRPGEAEYMSSKRGQGLKELNID